MRRLHLIDGTYELYRAHFSKRPEHTDPSGRPRKATVGLLLSLVQLIEDPAEAVTHLAIAFDNPIVSFRNDLFDGYKSDEGVPPELRAQFDVVEEGCRALGVTVWSMARWEADDALATAAVRFKHEVDQVRILTPDKDLGQVLDGARVVQVDRMRGKLIDEAALLEHKGLRPGSVADYLALVGDDADGVPGLAGFGAKSTAALLGEYGRLDAIPEDPATWRVAVRGAPVLAATLAAGQKEALLYRQLTRLCTDVPLAESLAELAYRGVPRAEFAAFSRTLGSSSLNTRVESLKSRA